MEKPSPRDHPYQQDPGQHPPSFYSFPVVMAFCYNTPGQTALLAHPEQGTRRMSAVEGASEPAELLEVNRQWDQQFRSMKELYAGKKEKQTLSEELLALKKENKLLKENNAAMSRRREHYECEIKRLNKALQEALKVECSPLPEDRLGGPVMGCGHEDMRTEMEVLKQQVQIYEEDFRRERSDRERLNREKEQLQQMNRTSQSQLNQLKSEPDRQRGAPGQLPPDAQHAAHGEGTEHSSRARLPLAARGLPEGGHLPAPRAAPATSCLGGSQRAPVGSSPIDHFCFTSPEVYANPQPEEREVGCLFSICCFHRFLLFSQVSPQKRKVTSSPRSVGAGRARRGARCL
ncbi:TNFAIP3-interacting protein 3 [Myotis davidii]|uniref:TNFAIP3-interacting protein 3 n=1 Tax=Myotis davidii TaxID=225400 RepID=L5MBD3_MYODS|nr:TNFAIP3-interacting protein 3 [Myotis davidii]